MEKQPACAAAISSSGLVPMPFSNRAFASAADQIAEALRLAILRGEFTPGQALSQEEIAKRFGVSRIPVRDAMNQLQAEGLLNVIASKGSFVANPSPDEVRETYEIRILLELEALRLAFRRHNPDTLNLAERSLRGFLPSLPKDSNCKASKTPPRYRIGPSGLSASAKVSLAIAHKLYLNTDKRSTFSKWHSVSDDAPRSSMLHIRPGRDRAAGAAVVYWLRF